MDFRTHDAKQVRHPPSTDLLLQKGIRMSLEKKVFEERLSGHLFSQIAELVHLENATDTKGYFEAFLKSEAGETSHEMLNLEHCRLDALHQAFWPAAISGDSKAATVILKTMDSRQKLIQTSEAIRKTEEENDPPYDGQMLREETRKIVEILKYKDEFEEWLRMKNAAELPTESDSSTGGSQDPTFPSDANPPLYGSNGDFQL